jgi:microcin C transport system ATP-binding protein
MAYLLISHDLSVVRAMSHRIISLKKGIKIKEEAL